MGGMIPTFISYAVEKRCSRYPEKFGTGIIEGVAGPESANNAASTGGFVPLLTLGVPANVVMAMMLGALMIQGIAPGPLLLSDHLPGDRAELVSPVEFVAEHTKRCAPWREKDNPVAGCRAP